MRSKTPLEAQGSTCLASVLLEFSDCATLTRGAWPFTSRAWFDGIGRFGPGDFYQLVNAFAALEVRQNRARALISHG